MAAVGGAMDESYAERAKKANVQSSFKNNFKPQVSRIPHDAVDVPSASTSDTLDSSPAHSSTHTPASNLMLPPSVPVSSASSEQASPLRSVNSLPPRNAWSDRSPWRTPQKAHPTANSNPALPNGSRNHDLLDSPAQETSQETRSRLTGVVKAPTKSNQQNDSDPFVVNYNLNTPSLVDAQNWPQVGIATAPVSSPHRSKPSVTSVSSTTVLSTPQTPAKGALESDNDATPSKKSKGEKTKWVPIPPKELQAAVDEVTRRSQPASSSSKSHSPHINGRGPRVHDDLSERRQGGRSLSRGDRSSPITTGNTRHDRNPSLTVPSSASSRRVSPLTLTTSLPSTSANTILDQVSASGSPLIPREPSPSQPQSRNIAAQRGRQNPAPFAFVEPFIPSHHPNRSSGHSRNPSQNPLPPSSPVVYTPMWPVAPLYMPYYPTQNPYHPMPTPTKPPLAPSMNLDDETRLSRSPRQPRSRRPQPEHAVALAGYRLHVAETLKFQEAERVLLNCDEEVSQAEDSNLLSGGSNPATRIRDLWWSYGVGEESISRWLRRQQGLKASSVTVQQLTEGPQANFGTQSEGSLPPSGDSPVESAILQGCGDHARETGQPIVTPTYHPGWTAPGAGPSAIDIGLAMGMPLPPSVLPPPPPLIIGMPPPPPYLPSPASTTSRNEWAARDDPFAMQSQHFAYQQYGYPPLPPNGHMPNYAADGQGRGNTRWRDDRYPTRGGRARGFTGRGRVFRGASVSRLPYNPQSSPGGSSQPAYPPQHLHNSATVYIPEPVMHPSMYPYPISLPPAPFNDYHQSPVTSTDSTSDSQARPPSPKPLTHLNFPLDATRYKLLGQIEYYFSRDNVAKDIYLRERMDSNGWVSMTVLQSFPRIQRLKVNDDLIRETLQWSHFVEVRHNYIRMAHEDWRNYVLPTAPESAVPDAPPPTWYPPPPFHPSYMAPMYPHPPHPYPYYHQPQKTSPLLQGGVADHILRRPEDKTFNGNGFLESGTSAGDSFDSTPHTEGEEVETSEDDVVFLIGDPLPMQRPAPVTSNT